MLLIENDIMQNLKSGTNFLETIVLEVLVGNQRESELLYILVDYIRHWIDMIMC